MDARFRLKAQLFCDGEIAMGPGKADLLEAIGREGSISAAGRSLGMSYRRAWELVRVMNRCWVARLVETSRGGNVGNARLTPLGHQVLAAYRALEERLRVSAEAEPGPLAPLLRPRPADCDDPSD